VRAGQTIVVLGAAGGVGSTLVQLARHAGIRAIGTAGTAPSTRDLPGTLRVPVLKLLARLTAWKLLPNGRRSTFVNLWAGRRLRPARYRAQLRHDLGGVLVLLAEGAITPRSPADSRSPTPPQRCATPRRAASPARSSSSPKTPDHDLRRRAR
jgi:hypothetical protein